MPGDDILGASAPRASGTVPPAGPAIPSAPTSHPPSPAGRPRRQWLRRLLWPVLAVAAVLAVAFFGGGWYFADQIRSGTLKVEPATPMRTYDDVRVVGLPGGQVQLRAMGDQPTLTKPELRPRLVWPCQRCPADLHSPPREHEHPTTAR